MKRIFHFFRFLFLGLFTVIQFSGCAAVDTKTATRFYDFDDELFGGMPENGLSVAVQPGKNGPFQVDILLKNESERRMLVNSHFLVDQGDYSSAPNIFLSLTEINSNRKIQLTEQRGTGKVEDEEAEPQWFELLGPKEYFKLTVDLTDYYSLDARKKYRFMCTYDNKTSGYSDGSGWVEKYAWVGTVTSNTMEVGRIDN